MKKLYPKQQETADAAVKVLRTKMIVYMACEVRTGKTPMSLEVARQAGWKKVLFLTKKKAVESIRKDYNDFGFNACFAIDIVNDESIHKIFSVDGYLRNYDGVIHDEHHRFKSFPKPSATAKFFKSKFSKLPQIYLSGTPYPESYSEVFHQFWVSDYSPFGQGNFYKWVADGFVRKYTKQLGHGSVNKYDRGVPEMILPLINPYFIRLTQKELGYVAEINENVLYVDMMKNTYALAELLKRDRVIEGREEVILADTAVKLQQKLHQLYSGTVLFEPKEPGARPNFKIFDTTKADFIKDHFAGKKKGIFYQFKAELEMLKKVFGDQLTTDIEEFNNTDKDIALQIVSGREGISLYAAEVLCYMNIDFSAVSYWQSRDRLTTKDRQYNEVFWIFARNGIEDSIYKTVQSKKHYTTNVFNKEFLKKQEAKQTKEQTIQLNEIQTSNLDMFKKHGVKEIKAGKTTYKLK